MGVLNVTPDSFYEGSRCEEGSHALEAATLLERDGADVVDVGGESTRPGAAYICAEQEESRVVPIVKRLNAAFPELLISVDTYKAKVARRAVEAGASLVNDVSGGLLDSDMPAVIAELGIPVVVGHLRGTPATMRDAPGYADVTAEVCDELGARIEAFVSAGVSHESIWVDPGLGFGKRAPASRELLFGLRRVVDLGYPVVIGASRKSFLGDSLERAGLGRLGPEARLEASLAAAVLAAERGAVLIRAHDVGPTRRALALLQGVVA